MNIEDYNFTKNGIKVSFDDFLLELRNMYRTEFAYTKTKEELLNKLEKGIESWNTISRVHLRISRKKNICPLCHKEIIGYPALSRRNSQIEICSNCGVLEALEDFIQYQQGEFKERKI